MREKHIHDSSVYHLCAGSQLAEFAEFAVLNSYAEYLAQFMQLKADHKGTRYLFTERDSRGVYHYYLRVVDVK